MTQLDAIHPWESLQAIRRTAPVVHSITNYVVMNTTANALLSAGASPVMAHAEAEMGDMVAIASALVLNIGTLSPAWVRSMRIAAESAVKRGIPIVLDPVGAGATPYRTETVKELLEVARPTIVRGNASEILAIGGEPSGTTRGVDSRDPSVAAISAAKHLNRTYGAAVCISGATDFVVCSSGVVAIKNGHAMMPKVTGLGCTASALCGAFAAVQGDSACAAAEAMVVLGIAGELAAEQAKGPGTLQLYLLDALYGMTEQDLRSRVRIEVVE